jgi:hypothetical protein
MKYTNQSITSTHDLIELPDHQDDDVNDGIQNSLLCFKPPQLRLGYHQY